MVVVGNFRTKADLRKNPRRQFHYNAKVVLSENGSALDCAIADISHSGARLVLETEQEVPKVFILLLTSQGNARRFCRLVWQEGATLGVEFPEDR